MSAAIQGIYVALFGRPADPGGLAYWTEVTKNGADLSAMLNVLPNLPEYTSRFDGQTPDQVITTIYQNLFGREPDADGLAFFKGQLESGAQTLATIAVNIMQGAQGDDKADVDAKVGAADLFTASLDTPEEIAGYSGTDAAELAKKFLDSVNKDAPVTQETVNQASAAVVAGQDPTGGQAPGGGGSGGGTPTPTDTAVSKVGSVSAVALNGSDNLWAGSGNKAGNFNITTTSLSEIEIALKGYKRGVGDTESPTDGVYSFGNDRAGFAYSVASLGDKSLSELIADGYSFHLTIDTHPGQGFGTNPHLLANFTLQAAVDSGDKVKVTDSGYNWVGTSNGLPLSIIDDEGNATSQQNGSVTQNIQTPVWYGGLSSGDIPVNGEYSVSLEVKKGATSVAKEEITLDVNSDLHSIHFNGRLSNLAEATEGVMINGTGNSSKDFRIVHLDLDRNGSVDMELALGGQIQKGNTYVPTPDGRVVAAGGGSDNGEGAPMFKFSVASLDQNKTLSTLLNTYDIKLLVDTDPSAKTNFVQLKAVADGSGTGLDWEFAGNWLDNKGNVPKLIDDAGNALVSQNIQAIGWYQPDGNTLFNDYSSNAGTYTVSLAMYKAGTTDLVGINTLNFEVPVA